jgi:two-component system, response regulator PdtaR
MSAMRRTNVLMVEDEVLISELMAEVLTENGFEVHAVPDAESALRYVDDGSEVDVLFTDINLLGHMDGSTLAKEVRERRPDIPIVYCSGRYSASALSPLVSRSIFLKKPYNPDELCMLLTRLTATEH